MEVRQARAFLAVAEDLNFGRAAARLHMAQPPLSRLIRTLERELGVVLFERDTKHVALTLVGDELVEPARELVMQSERISLLAHRVRRGEAGRVRLGFAGSSVNSIVSAITRRVRVERPGLRLELFGSQLSYPGLERLRSGSLDAVIGRWDFLPDDVHSCVIAQEELVVVLPDDHRLAGVERLSATDVAEEPWVVLPGGQGASLSNRLHLLGGQGRFVPRIVQTAVDSATQLLLVGAGAGIALTFSGVRENIPAQGVVFRPLDVGLGPVDVRLAWSSLEDNAALRAVIAIAESLSPLAVPACDSSSSFSLRPIQTGVRDDPVRVACPTSRSASRAEQAPAPRVFGA